MKVMRLLVVLALCGLLTSILGACGTDGVSASSASGPTVHMKSTSFVQAEITIQKGQSVTLINDDLLTPHVIANGTWEHSTARPENEPGAPKMDHVQMNGNSQLTIGPFSTTGTFTFYCTIHPGMNLTVRVRS